jgi:hypothetical protein
MSAAAGTKESDLVMAVLLYAMRCLAEGDQQALRDMNFGPKEMGALREINLADLYRVGSLQAHCLEIRLNRDVYWPMLAHLHRERKSEEMQRDLIQADAPLEMMRSLFGVGSREYTRLRRLLTSDPAIGRPPEPDDATSHALWQRLSRPRSANRCVDARGVEPYPALGRVRQSVARRCHRGDGERPLGPGTGRPLNRKYVSA